MTDLKERISNTILAVKETLEKNSQKEEVQKSLEQIKKLENKRKKE